MFSPASLLLTFNAWNALQSEKEVKSVPVCNAFMHCIQVHKCMGKKLGHYLVHVYRQTKKKYDMIEVCTH